MTKCFVCKKEVSMGDWMEMNQDKPILFCEGSCMKVFTKRLTSEAIKSLEIKHKNGEISKDKYDKEVKRYNQFQP